MPRTLKYFMWGYQPHFRLELRLRAEDVLGVLGVDLQPETLLIGVRVPEATNGHDVCFEPEEDWAESDLRPCFELAQTTYDSHPGHDMMYGDAPRMRDKPENIRRDSVRSAVEKVVSPLVARQGRIAFFGYAVRVDSYHVVPVLLLDAQTFSTLPLLPTPVTFDRWTSSESFQHSLISHLLDEASEILGTKEPGRFSGAFDREVSTLQRAAAQSFCMAIGLAVGDVFLREVFHAANNISGAKYEGGSAHGTIVFLPPSDPEIEYKIHLKRPVSLTQTKLARKVIEMSGPDLVCVCTSSSGVAGLANPPPPGGRPFFRVVITGHHEWYLAFGETVLMTTSYGVPTVPRLRLTKEQFASTARRVLPGLDESKADALWGAVEAAMKQKHGTMLVVSEAADEEAQRLGSQCLPIEAIQLDAGVISTASGIDGALLVDPDARCHALGVILDGMACDDGDPARGARYNSAHRYVASSPHRCLCVVVSEDGYIDMIPHLRPQISRALVAGKVEKLRSLNKDSYHQTRNWLDEHRFYLTADQCDVVNAELARIDAEPREVGEIKIVNPPFQPDPDMGEDYYLVGEEEAAG
jgi:hypothetical protein